MWVLFQSPEACCSCWPSYYFYLKISSLLCSFRRITELKEIGSDSNITEADSFPDLQHLSSSNIQRPSSDIKMFPSLSFCLSFSPEPSEPSIEICNTMQRTINLQKTHYLIVHWGTRASPGRWWKGKWNERRTVSPVFIMLMEWADRLNEEREMWLCLEDGLQRNNQQNTTSNNQQT